MTDSVSKPTPWHNPPEMSAFGYMIAAGIVLVLLPLLPFIALLYIAGRVRQSNALQSVVGS